MVRMVFQDRRKVLPLIAFVFMAVATCVAALLTSETRVPSVGTVKTVGLGRPDGGPRNSRENKLDTSSIFRCNRDNKLHF